MKLDAHQHFWRYDPAQYPWIPRGSPLQRDWLPADLAELQGPLGFSGSIAVQARQSIAESDWLLELAEADPRIQGVVGWVDLRSEHVDADLTRLARHPRFVGVRHVVQDEPEDAFLLRADVLRGLSRLQAHGLAYDLLVYPKQLPAAIEVVQRLPGQRFVLDHLAKPRIKARELLPWAGQIRTLAKFSNVSCKLSGLVTEADLVHWKPDDFRAYLDVAFEAFGPRRLMFGSDWPVCLLAASYQRVVEVVEASASCLDEAGRSAVFGGNAATFYRRTTTW